MLLICPSCSAHYEVPEGSIPSQGRQVKCAACDHTWSADQENEVNSWASLDPAALQPDWEASHGRSKVYFSRPASPSRGSAALAALFDEPLPDPDISLIDGSCLPVRHKSGNARVEERLAAALSARPIARLLEQQGRERSADSPFRQDIASLQEAEAVPVLPVPTSGTLDLGDGEVSAQLAGQPRHDDAYPPVSEPAPSLFRSLVRFLVNVAAGLGDFFADIVPKRVFRSSPVTKKPVSPGDAEVSEWRQRERRRARNKLTPLRFSGWLAWAATITGILYVTTVQRDDVMNIWPQTKTTYALMGGMPKEAISLEDISYRFAMSDKGPVVELKGSLSHTGERPAVTPLVRADALNARGDILTSWTFRIKGPRQLLPQMETPFMSRVLAPDGMTHVELSIVPQSEREAIDLARTEEIVMPGDGEAGQQIFFMQKTTLGWTASPEDQAPPQQ